MLEENGDAAEDRCHEEKGEESDGTYAALHNGANPEQEGRVEDEVVQISMKETETEEAPVLAEQLTAVGKCAEAEQDRVIA